MPTIRFESPVRLKETVAAALQEKLVYTAPGVSGVRIESVQDRKPEISFEYEGDLAESEIIGRAAALVREFSRGFLEVEREILYDRRHVVPACQKPVYDAMVQAGWVVPYETGRVMLAGPAARLFAFFDAEFARIARDYDAQPVKFPVLISVDTLKKADYFANFPHHITLASHLVEDADILKSLVQTASRNPQELSFFGDCLCTSHVNSPAVCFHYYEALSGRRLGSAAMRITAVGPSFRYEAGNLRTLERLWDFTMREIVFVGPSGEVDALRMSAMEPVMALVDALGLKSHIETASDPFFVGNFAGQTFYQLSHRTKFELRLYLPFEEGRSLAAASFNWHQQFFGTRFGILTESGEPAGTACVAFGVERWVYAFVAQYGLNPECYPAYLLERW